MPQDNPKLEPHPHMKARSEKSKPQLNTRDFRVSGACEEKKSGFVFFIHGFKNRTGPAGPTGSTGNRPLIRSGYTKKPEIS